MAIRHTSSQATGEDFESLLSEVMNSGDRAVLDVNGRPAAMLTPLNEEARNEIARELFGRFWDAHKVAMREQPVELSEDETLDLVNEEIAAYRREKARQAGSTHRQ